MAQKSKPLRMLVAEHVRQAMESNPTIDTQQKLAKKAGIGQSHVSRLLRGENVTLDVVEKIAGACAVEPFELVIEEEKTKEAIIARVFAARPSVKEPFPALPKPKTRDHETINSDHPYDRPRRVRRNP